MTTKTRDDLQWLMTLLGPEALADLSGPLSPELRDLLARHDGDPVAALDAQHLPADVQATMRRVLEETR